MNLEPTPLRDSESGSGPSTLMPATSGMSDEVHNHANPKRDVDNVPSADTDLGRDTQNETMDDDEDVDEEDYYEDEEFEDLDEMDEDEYEDEDEDGGSLDDYMQHRYSPTSSDDSPNDPLPNPFSNPAAGFPNVDPDANLDYGLTDVQSEINEGPTINLGRGNNTNIKPKLGKIEMPAGGNKLNLGLGVSVFIDSGQTSVCPSGATSVRDPNNKHLASSPLIMNSQEAVSNFLVNIYLYITRRIHGYYHPHSRFISIKT